MKLSRRDFNRAAVGAIGLAAAGAPAWAGDTTLLRKAIPSSGEPVPVIGLGTNRYGVGPEDSARTPLRDALARFHELGGTVIDTAPAYRSSESVLGDLIAELDIRDGLFIATKTDREAGGNETRSQLRESQARLKSRVFDLMQVHNLRGWREALPVLREWQQEGLVRYIGITTSRDSEYEEFERVMRTETLDFVQLNYSLEQRAAAARLMPLAADRGMAVMINRAFGGGRIFARVGAEPLPDWAQAFGCASWAQFLLKYAIAHPAATLAIPGMTKVRHVEDNLGAARGRLPDADERRRQEAFFDAL